MAGATQARRLLGVGSTAWLGGHSGPAAGLEAPRFGQRRQFCRGSLPRQAGRSISTKGTTKTTSAVPPVPLETRTACSILLVYHLDCSTHPGMDAALEEVGAYAQSCHLQLATRRYKN
jgi:hypothetical protein